MKKVLKIVGLAILSAFLTSCENTHVKLNVANNVGQDITIIGFGKQDGENQVLILQGQMKEASLGIIKYAKGEWEYDLPPSPPLKYMKLVQRFPQQMYLMKLQVEKDGTIYLMPRDAEEVVTIFPPQPSGFPIRPIK